LYHAQKRLQERSRAPQLPSKQNNETFQRVSGLTIGIFIFIFLAYLDRHRIATTQATLDKLQVAARGGQ
jgi:hypothetical protein